MTDNKLSDRSSSSSSSSQSAPRRRLETRASKLQQLSPEQLRAIRKSATNNTPRDPVYLYSSLVAGVGSGALSSILCAPLDLIRVRMQVYGQVLAAAKTSEGGVRTSIPLRQIVKEIRQAEGWRGFFRGLGATLLTVPAFWGVYFPLYDDFKRRWAHRHPETNPALIHMGSAVLSGAISDVICNPMFVVRTRLQTEALHNMAEQRRLGIANPRIEHTSILSTARSLFREGGVPIFWRGMSANLMGLSHVAIQFPVYEQLKKVLRNRKRHESAIDLVLASSLSKMTASLLTYPHEVIRSRMMDARAAHVGFWSTCNWIYQREGIMGFYAGLPVSLARVIPNTCITFVTYELFLRWSRAKIQERRERSATLTA